MQSPCLHLCKTFFTSSSLRFHKALLQPSSSTTESLSILSNFPKFNTKRLVTRCHNRPHAHHHHGQSRSTQRGLKVKGKNDNMWSVDNDMAKATTEREKERARGRAKQRRRGRRMVRGKRNKAGRIMVSGAMLMEVETVLQTQEPVIRPAWNTFASSVSGIWEGVGAVFSPITAEMEPIEIGSRNENLYDCYTLSRIEAMPPSSGGQLSVIKRKINWVTLNPYGEVPQNMGGNKRSKGEHKDDHSSLARENTIDDVTGNVLPYFESFDFGRSDLMEEDVVGNESGLVFFEDGSYSRGPVDIPVGEFDDSKYYLSPVFKFEQCLVKGCHKRLRIVHTIEFNNGGSDIQIMRVAVYEEQWVSPANIHDESDLEFDLKPFSQRKRTQPSELTGSWKVFEVSATPIHGEEMVTGDSSSTYGEEMVTGDSSSTSYVYLCTETLKKRSFPENSVYFGEEEILDMQDATVLWLPGGITCYVDVNKEGILCIGVGWYSDEGINLVMERDYGADGKLKEVRCKSELKRRWSDPLPV